MEVLKKGRERKRSGDAVTTVRGIIKQILEEELIKGLEVME